MTESIRSLVASEDPIPSKEVLSDGEEEGEEGQLLTRMHRYRERDTKLVKRKKALVIKEAENFSVRCAILTSQRCIVNEGMVSLNVTTPNRCPRTMTHLRQFVIRCSLISPALYPERENTRDRPAGSTCLFTKSSKGGGTCPASRRNTSCVRRNRFPHGENRYVFCLLCGIVLFDDSGLCVFDFI